MLDWEFFRGKEFSAKNCQGFTRPNKFIILRYGKLIIEKDFNKILSWHWILKRNKEAR